MRPAVEEHDLAVHRGAAVGLDRRREGHHGGEGGRVDHDVHIDAGLVGDGGDDGAEVVAVRAFVVVAEQYMVECARVGGPPGDRAGAGGQDRDRDASRAQVGGQAWQWRPQGDFAAAEQEGDVAALVVIGDDIDETGAPSRSRASEPCCRANRSGSSGRRSCRRCS
ncbi:hypothetical protein [Nocardia otitidiscaviarum]|uniref:hypothetical protein n=1 Tax=Nocardia otitidiscaviarum TaxID=1823 RepID=UPI0011C04458|nr:hypothetical protein [Nocardia otitidiscaviarum]